MCSTPVAVIELRSARNFKPTHNVLFIQNRPPRGLVAGEKLMLTHCFYRCQQVPGGGRSLRLDIVAVLKTSPPDQIARQVK